jgi:hypothetical protein
LGHQTRHAGRTTAPATGYVGGFPQRSRK